MGRDTSEGIRCAVTGDGVSGVLYMLYADGLSFNANDPGEMQAMLNRLQAYAMRKGLTVNTLSQRSCNLIAGRVLLRLLPCMETWLKKKAV
eukprot:1154929-Pelagomonas_calceolata.AAC.3